MSGIIAAAAAGDDDGDELPLDLALSGIDEQVAAEMAKHSAKYLKARNPRMYAAIKMSLEWGISQNVIVKQCGVSHNLVSAIREGARPVSLDTHKREVVAGLQRLGRGILRRLTDAVESGEEIPFQALGIVFGIVTEKEQLLQGAPTQRVEHTEAPEVTAFRQMLIQQAQRRGIVLPVGNLDAKAGDSARLQSGPVVDVEGDS